MFCKPKTFIKRFYEYIPLYCAISISTLQVSRIFCKYREGAYYALNLSIFPYAVFHFLSRNYHPQLGACWEVSILLMCLQISSFDRDTNNKWLIWTAATWIATYIAMAFMYTTPPLIKAWLPLQTICKQIAYQQHQTVPALQDSPPTSPKQYASLTHPTMSHSWQTSQ